MTAGPIFILGIQRGGTNQVLNILRSHPATYWPQGEFHEVFRPSGLRRDGVKRTLRLLRRYAPILLGAGDVLDPDTEPRRAGLLAGRAGRAVRAGLEGSAAANRASVAAYKDALRSHGLLTGTAAPDRMLTKAVNYNLALVPDLLALYPDARFVGVIRDGRAVCEGHIARGASLAAATATYAFVGRQLIELEAAGLPLRTWRFEDLVADAEATAAAIYGFCGLDPAAVRGVCLQDKERIVNARGGVAGMRKVALFYSFADMGRHMRADANAGALSRLPDATRAAITERCRPVLEHFGYLGDQARAKKAAAAGSGQVR
jgi:Sulfotransferase family